MAKTKQKAKAAASQGADQSAAPTPTPEVKPATLVVLKKDAKFRGAREAWYKRLVDHDGKPANEYLESCRTNPPAVPKSGKAENPGGWLSYFKRQGVVETKPA